MSFFLGTQTSPPEGTEFPKGEAEVLLPKRLPRGGARDSRAEGLQEGWIRKIHTSGTVEVKPDILTSYRRKIQFNLNFTQISHILQLYCGSWSLGNIKVDATVVFNKHKHVIPVTRIINANY